jgi:hypothetical protein
MLFDDGGFEYVFVCLGVGGLETWTNERIKGK